MLGYKREDALQMGLSHSSPAYSFHPVLWYVKKKNTLQLESFHPQSSGVADPLPSIISVFRVRYWRASVASETLTGVKMKKSGMFVYLFICDRI